jgi:endonuclease III
MRNVSRAAERSVQEGYPRRPHERKTHCDPDPSAGREPASDDGAEFNSPFELLIAVLLSAQATDVSVNKATALLYPVANTPKAMLELGGRREVVYQNHRPV